MRKKKAQVLRWVWAGLALGLSPLYFFQAPKMPLFITQLALTEFGHWLALPSLILAMGPWARGPERRTRAACLAAALLFLSPALRAWLQAPVFAREAAQHWPTAPEKLSPAFSWNRLFFGDKPGPPLLREDEVFDPEHALSLTCWRRADEEGLLTARPMVLVIHGGGWETGQRNDFPAWNAAIAAEGYVVIDADYRLAPASPWPAQREDILRALEHARLNAKRWGIDPKRCVLMGRSAGAHLALATAYLLEDSAIKGVASFYGPADLFFAYKFGTEDDVLHSPQLLREFCGGSPETVRANYMDASPYFHVGPKTPPTFMAHGRIDSLVWQKQSARLSTQLEQAGRPYEFLDLPWATHGFDYNFHGPSGQLAWHGLQRFLATTLK